MKPKYSNVLRQAEQGEGTAGGGASNVIPLAPAADAPAAEAPAAEPPKATLLEGVLGAMQSKGALVAQLNDLKGKITAADAEVITLKAAVESKDGEITKLRAELATLNGERAQIQAALEASQKEVRTVEDAAIVQIGALGFSAEKLPEAAAEDAEQTVEALEKQLAAETDPKRIFTLNQQLEAAKKAKKAG